MKTVSNTSPLIFFSKVSRLELLKNMFGTIFIPPEVAEELKFPHLPPWILIKKVHWQDYGKIGKGESAAIALAVFEHSLLLIDDHRGRTIAKYFEVKMMGTVGILLFALEKKILSLNECKYLITTLVSDHGLYLSSDLFAKVMREL